MPRDRRLGWLVLLSPLTTIASIAFGIWLLASHPDSLPRGPGGRFGSGEPDTVIRTPEQADAWRRAHGQDSPPSSAEQRKAHEDLCRIVPTLDACRKDAAAR